MNARIFTLLVVAGVAVASVAPSALEQRDKLRQEAASQSTKAAKAFDAIMQVPDKAIPRELLSKAKAITLAPGKTALVAQIYEEDTAAVDKRLSDLGAVVFRRPVGDVADDEYETALAKVKRRLA